MKSFLKALVVAAALSGSSLAYAGPNLVTNGSFEDGSSGWILQGVGVTSQYWARTGTAVIGTGCVGIGCVDSYSSGAYFAQTLDTSIGSEYALSLWVVESGAGPSALSVFWNGLLVDLIANPAHNTLRYDRQTGLNTANWVQYKFDHLTATSSSTALEIHGRHDPAGIFFDDISVAMKGATDVPEPTSLALLGIGALALTRRRFNK
jgi:hypothetical protein